MVTIKLGSRGADVVTLQKKLNLTPDGNFGPLTDKAVREFQKKNGLTADGIVGPKTWEALGVIDSKCIDPSVIYKPLPVHVTKSSRTP